MRKTPMCIGGNQAVGQPFRPHILCRTSAGRHFTQETFDNLLVCRWLHHTQYSDMCDKLRDNPPKHKGAAGVITFFVEWDSLFLGLSANDGKPDLTEDVADAECGFVHFVSFQLCTPTITLWIEVLLNRAGVITRTKRRHRAGARLDRIPPPQISPDRKLQQALLGAMRGCTHGFFRVGWQLWATWSRGSVLRGHTPQATQCRKKTCHWPLQATVTSPCV